MGLGWVRTGRGGLVVGSEILVGKQNTMTFLHIC